MRRGKDIGAQRLRSSLNGRKQSTNEMLPYLLTSLMHRCSGFLAAQQTNRSNCKIVVQMAPDFGDLWQLTLCRRLRYPSRCCLSVSTATLKLVNIITYPSRTAAPKGRVELVPPDYCQICRPSVIYVTYLGRGSK